MHTVISKKKKKAIIIGLHLPHRNKQRIEDSLEELKSLAGTAGIETAGVEMPKRSAPDPAFYIGSGKADKIAIACREKKIDIVIFDEELTPAQVKNLQNLFGIDVIDRTELILNIFARHARSREGRLQTEIAQLQYLLPRLTHIWGHLSRQWGKLGAKGPGEKQLEIDQRRVKTQIAKLKQDLASINRNRQIQQKHRKRTGIPLVSIIGYTNAGKTTLFNRLAETTLPAGNKLFTTLDQKTKRFILPNNQEIILSDTVGFIRKLPHHLIEAFKSTLEGIKEANVILHIIDGTDKNLLEHYDITLGILRELGINNKPAIVAINKIDRNHSLFYGELPDSIPISAKEGTGIDSLLYKLQAELNALRKRIKLFIPLGRDALISKIYRLGTVLDVKYMFNGVKVKAELPVQDIGELEKWIIH